MITEFLSEENITLHKEYIRQKRLKYSILESSLPSVRGASVGDLFRLKLDKRDRRDALLLLPEIVLHDVFFSSFSEERYVRSESVSSIYGSEAKLLNELYRLSKDKSHGFLIIDSGGSASVVTDYATALRFSTPKLALDLCEHAYFLDYGFDKERYLVTALSYLNLKKITT